MAQIDPKLSVQETNFWDADIIIDIATGAQEREKQNSCLSGRLAGVLIRHERQLSIVLRPSNQIWRWQAWVNSVITNSKPNFRKGW
jgi:hypothetical protein